MTLQQYLGIAKRWWWLVLVGCLLAGGSAYVLTSRMTPVYSARAIVLVNQVQNPGGVTYQDILGSKSLTKTYAALATSTTNLQRALVQLGDTSADVRSLGRQVSASDLIDTQLIYISAEDPSPERAARIANVVAEAFPGYIRDAQLAGASEGTNINTVFVAEQAMPPHAPVRPNTKLNVALGVFLGLVVMLGAVAVIEYLDDDIDTEEDIAALGLPFMGSVIRVEPPKGIKNRDDWVPNILGGNVPEMAESYRKLQANLSFSLRATGATVLLVTSASPGEGKSTTAANLAIVLAESSRRVLLIDGDLRKPTLHRVFSLPNTSGLSGAFLTQHTEPPFTVDAKRVLTASTRAFLTRHTEPPFTPWLTDTLSLMTSGVLPPNPPELLASTHMAALMTMLREEFDVIVVDSPPILAVADTSLWLALTNGVILVAREGKTRRGTLAAAASAIKASTVPILGVVLNASNPKASNSYYYGYTEPHASNNR